MDLSLVDPDNRREVDYPLRRRVLGALELGDAPEPTGVGAAKLALLHRLLMHRRERPDIYKSEIYEPILFRGERRDDTIGYHRGDLAVVVACRGGDDWGYTTAMIPRGAWTDLITGRAVEGGTSRLSELLVASPVAILSRPL